MCIIQIGCYKSIDKHIEKYRSNGYFIFLVDANKEALDNIPDSYGGIKKLHLAVGDQNDTITFYKTGKGLDYDYVASMYINHVSRHDYSNIQREKVNCVTLEKLISDYTDNMMVEGLYIDAEGMDLCILKQAIEQTIISIVYESGHISDNKEYQDTLNKAKELGYKFKQLDSFNACLYLVKEPYWDPS